MLIIIICIAVWQVDMVELEEGGMFDEDTMPDWMRSMRGVAPANRLQPPPLMAPAPAPFPEPIQQIPPGTGRLSSPQKLAAFIIRESEYFLLDYLP
jgi:hypothetical protein